MNTNLAVPVKSPGHQQDGSGMTAPLTTTAKFQNLMTAMESRRKKTPFITEQQRTELRQRCHSLILKPHGQPAFEHLKWLRDTGCYQAAAGSWPSFCTEILGFSETEAERLMGDHSIAPQQHAPKIAQSQSQTPPLCKKVSRVQSGNPSAKSEAAIQIAGVSVSDVVPSVGEKTETTAVMTEVEIITKPGATPSSAHPANATDFRDENGLPMPEKPVAMEKKLIVNGVFSKNATARARPTSAKETNTAARDQGCASSQHLATTPTSHMASIATNPAHPTPTVVQAETQSKTGVSAMMGKADSGSNVSIEEAASTVANQLGWPGPIHPVAQLFNVMDEKEFSELRENIRKNGQIHPIIVDGKTLLDGRHRLRACRELGIDPRFVRFSELNTTLDPATWIIQANLHRRHLTRDQRLAIAAKLQAWGEGQQAQMQAEAVIAPGDKQASSATINISTESSLSAPQVATKSATSEFPQKPAETRARRKPGRPKGMRGKAEALAKQAQETRYRAEQMLEVQKQSPELAAKVEKGQVSLRQAHQQVKECHAKKAGPQPAPNETCISKAVDRAKRLLDQVAKKIKSWEQVEYWDRVAKHAAEEAVFHRKSPNPGHADE